MTHRRFVVSYDIRIPGVVEVGALDANSAELLVCGMPAEKLLKNANTECAEVDVDSVHVEDETTEHTP